MLGKPKRKTSKPAGNTDGRKIRAGTRKGSVRKSGSGRRDGPKNGPVSAKTRIPFRQPGRYLRLDVVRTGGRLTVLHSRVIEGPLIRPAVPIGGLVYQATVGARVLWIDTVKVDAFEYGIRGGADDQHSVGASSSPILIGVRVPLRGATISKDLKVRLFQVQGVLPRTTATLDEWLKKPGARPRELEFVGNLSMTQIAKHTGFSRTLARAGVTVPGLRLKAPVKSKPYPRVDPRR